MPYQIPHIYASEFGMTSNGKNSGLVRLSKFKAPLSKVLNFGSGNQLSQEIGE
jgi:hypothetical protein